MLIAAAIILAAAGIFGLVTSGSSSDGDDRVVRIYGEAMGAAPNELNLVRLEALATADDICSTNPAEFLQRWDATSIGSAAALDIAEIRCPEVAGDVEELLPPRWFEELSAGDPDLIVELDGSLSDSSRSRLFGRLIQVAGVRSVARAEEDASSVFEIRVLDGVDKVDLAERLRAMSGVMLVRPA